MAASGRTMIEVDGKISGPDFTHAKPAYVLLAVVAAVLVQLEGQSAHPGIREASFLCRPILQRHWSGPCNTLPCAPISTPTACRRAGPSPFSPPATTAGARPRT